VLKQLGFYTDCFGNAHWSKPDDVVDEKLARMVIEIAEIHRPSDETTVREVELWIEHVGSKKGEDIGAGFAGLQQFYEAMKREGLSSHSMEDVAKFLGLMHRHIPVHQR